ncbi:MAG: hypothetical protein K0U64_11040 [Actinomycetia bacterium]|nr:hypothetical protein [Actinomycetes bacterium]
MRITFSKSERSWLVLAFVAGCTAGFWLSLIRPKARSPYRRKLDEEIKQARAERRKAGLPV